MTWLWSHVLHGIRGPEFFLLLAVAAFWFYTAVRILQGRD